MLAELGIYAVSVELGGAEPLTKRFFITDKTALKNLLLESEPWITSTMGFLMPRVHCELTQSSKMGPDNDRVHVVTTFACENTGLALTDSLTYSVHLNFIVAGGPTTIKQVKINDKKTITTTGCWIAKDCFFLMPAIKPLAMNKITILAEIPASTDDELVESGNLFSLAVVGPDWTF